LKILNLQDPVYGPDLKALDYPRHPAGARGAALACGLTDILKDFLEFRRKAPLLFGQRGRRQKGPPYLFDVHILSSLDFLTLICNKDASSSLLRIFIFVKDRMGLFLKTN
jgi:hypothetical protein